MSTENTRAVVARLFTDLQEGSTPSELAAHFARAAKTFGEAELHADGRGGGDLLSQGLEQGLAVGGLQEEGDQNRHAEAPRGF